jgi:hypothetical protein
MLMLAEYPEWQEHAWTEILKVCGPKIDMDAFKLNQLKIVSAFLKVFNNFIKKKSPYIQYINQWIQGDYV